MLNEFISIDASTVANLTRFQAIQVKLYPRSYERLGNGGKKPLWLRLALIQFDHYRHIYRDSMRLIIAMRASGALHWSLL